MQTKSLAVRPKLGDTNQTGVSAALGVEAGGTTKGNGLYAAVDAFVNGQIGARYVGIGGGVRRGIGIGAYLNADAANRAGRLEASGDLRAGLGATFGASMNLWLDYGRLRKDVAQLGSWLGAQLTFPQIPS